MPFKLVHSNKHGTFKVDLVRDISAEEAEQLCAVAFTIVPCEEKVSSERSYPGPYAVPYGPQRPPTQTLDLDQQDLFNHANSKKLGENPVDKINLGNFVPPTDGVRIKMLHMVETDKVPVIKMVRDVTGISLMGCREICYGNYPCPILSLEMAQKILENFRTFNVFAKIVPALEDAA